MNDGLIGYINDILDLRGAFSDISKVEKGSEIMKIWARWIITHRSLCPQTHLFLPDDDTFDSQLLIELLEKGVSTEHAKYLYDWLINECHLINNRYTLEQESPTPTLALTKDTSTIGYITLICANLSQAIPVGVFNSMSKKYNGAPQHKDNYIWLCTMIYDILDGKGLQWAVPPAVMVLLQTYLGCYTELFASPLNAYNKHYYSLFPLDKLFGSRGNFFTAPDSDFIEGTFQINPPFIDQLFTKTSERILELLDIADRNNKELTFIYIMPEWKDFVTYDMVAESRFCVKRIFLRSGQHCYYQYSSGCYIHARFGSYIFFLSTNSKICPNILENNIRHAFQGRPVVYRDR